MKVAVTLAKIVLAQLRNFEHKMKLKFGISQENWSWLLKNMLIKKDGNTMIRYIFGLIFELRLVFGLISVFEHWFQSFNFPVKVITVAA